MIQIVPNTSSNFKKFVPIRSSRKLTSHFEFNECAFVIKLFTVFFFSLKTSASVHFIIIFLMVHDCTLNDIEEKIIIVIFIKVTELKITILRTFICVFARANLRRSNRLTDLDAVSCYVLW